jgi:hypothetical protein
MSKDIRGIIGEARGESTRQEESAPEWCDAPNQRAINPRQNGTNQIFTRWFFRGRVNRGGCHRRAFSSQKAK